MSPTATLATAASAPALRARAVVRASGNSNSSRTLDNGGRDGSQARGRAQDGGALSQNGTEPSAPLWNGPVLLPAFVAQVLGQVMMDGSGPAPGAYRSAAQIGPGIVFDGAV